ncbi:uncharacterized protein FA14DRAFT_155706 [Meira miltonrushii]|uniref:Ecp2 effector protein domain-containing protein n=1 Tax=Meira miltonrushii TaxID=1280837 RepID=A0A316VFI6_9BASI|nr:uncharacterized protein FA14DRAFT_155706 [Meira miltonrushii]PWN36300.1 hypothetical protein FA14DRAFT_155706 [Meira miltonrushii]
MKFTTNILALAFLASAFALPPKGAFHKKLQGNINPDGIQYVDVKHFKSCGTPGTRCLKLAPGARAQDAAYYTVNSTKAKCNTKWKLPGGNGEERDSGECIAKERVTFLIECAKAKNANGKSNWIGVWFNDKDANFMAFGDAKARFAQNGRKGGLTDEDSTKDKNPIVEIICPQDS